MFEGRKRWVVVLALILGLSSLVPFWFAWASHPTSAPVKGSFTPVTIPLQTSASSTETFVVSPTNVSNLLGSFLPINTITYSVNGSSMTSQTLLNLTVTLHIDPLYQASGYSVIPFWVTIEDSEQWLVGGPYKTPLPYGADTQLLLHLVSNNSQFGLTYSTTVQVANGSSFVSSNDIISINNGESLTGTVELGINPTVSRNSSSWFEPYDLAIRNTTRISIQPYQDLQLAQQTALLENANLANNVQAQYDNALAQYDNQIVTSLTFVIVGFVLVDIGISFYELSEKKV